MIFIYIQVLLALSAAIIGDSRGDVVQRGDTVQEFKYHSFQVQVQAFKKECFYQYLTQNTSVSLIWHVMSAAAASELAAIVTLKKEDPEEFLYTAPYGQMGDYRVESLDKGTYEICIDNGMSYVSKLVYLWFDYQKVSQWDDVVAEDLDVKKYQFKQGLIRDILRSLEIRLRDMNYYQALYREKSVYHDLSLQRLEAIINNRSLTAFVLVIITAVLQVTFVRKLFQTPAQTATKSGI